MSFSNEQTIKELHNIIKSEIFIAGMLGILIGYLIYALVVYLINKKTYRKMVKMLVKELDNNANIIHESTPSDSPTITNNYSITKDHSAISFEVFKSYIGNTLFIQNLSKKLIEDIWDQYGKLRTLKNSIALHEKNSDFDKMSGEVKKFDSLAIQQLIIDLEEEVNPNLWLKQLQKKFTLKK